MLITGCSPISSTHWRCTAMSPNNTILTNPRKYKDLAYELATPGVYVIHNTQTDTFYIGQGQVVIKRLHDHFSDLSSSDHNNAILQREYSKFGADSFVIDLLHDMPGSNETERTRQETKEIQRFKRYHRRLYNKVLSTIKTKQSSPRTKHSSYPLNKPEDAGGDNYQTMANYYQKELEASMTHEEPEYTDMETCVDCGGIGTILIGVFNCDDGRVRCGPCLDKLLDAWTIDFSSSDQQAIDKRATQAYFRWQLDNRNYIKQEVANAISRFIEKYEQSPTILYVNPSHIGESEFKGIKVRKRKITPRLCLDIPVHHVAARQQAK